MAKRTNREVGFEDMIQLTSTRMTATREMPTDPDVMNYQPRRITQCAEIEYLNQGAEMDLAVIILGRCSASMRKETILGVKVFFFLTLLIGGAGNSYPGQGCQFQQSLHGCDRRFTATHSCRTSRLGRPGLAFVFEDTCQDSDGECTVQDKGL